MSFTPKYGSSVTTVTAAADVATIDVLQQEILWFSFTVGVANLSAFVVQFDTGAGYFNVASATADYTTPNGPVEGASGDLTGAAFGSTVYWLKINVKGEKNVKIRAAGTASPITWAYCGQ